MLIKEFLSELVTNTLGEITPYQEILGPSSENASGIKVTIADPKFGDFTTNIAMEWARTLKEPPRKIAEDIIRHLNDAPALSEIVEKIDIAGPGFINLHITSSLRKRALSEIVNRAHFYKKTDTGFNTLTYPNLSSRNQGKKILLEYVSANPTGPLHVGHGRWAVIGSVLAKIFSLTGYSVHQESYINDAGLQISKLRESITAVQEGKPIPEDGYHGDYVFDLAKTKSDPVETILKEHRAVLESVGTHMDEFFSEQSLYNNGLVEKTLNFIKENHLAYEQDGAWWFASTKEGDDKDRVLVRSNGETTYFGVDVAYHYTKFTRGYNFLINVLGADHHGYVKRIESAVSLITEKKADLKVIIGQLVSVLRGGKPVRMSKRSGDFVLLEDVVKEIGVDAFRYFFSMRSPNMPLEFDLEVAKEKSLNNPVYYIQYTHARIHSIFSKAQEMDIKSPEVDTFDFNAIKNPTTVQIVNQLLLFEEELLGISENFEIQRLNNYLYDLSSLFHRYYSQEMFLNDNSPAEKKRSCERLFLLNAIDEVIVEGLYILGISAPNTM